MTKCSNPIFHQEKCLEAKQRLIKTVRLRLPSVAHLIPTLDLKIIVLHRDPRGVQRYTYRVLQTIQMKLILLSVWAEPAVLGSTRTALRFKYEIQIG